MEFYGWTSYFQNLMRKLKLRYNRPTFRDKIWNFDLIFFQLLIARRNFEMTNFSYHNSTTGKSSMDAGFQPLSTLLKLRKLSIYYGYVESWFYVLISRRQNNLVIYVHLFSIVCLSLQHDVVECDEKKETLNMQVSCIGLHTTDNDLVMTWDRRNDKSVLRLFSLWPTIVDYTYSDYLYQWFFPTGPDHYHSTQQPGWILVRFNNCFGWSWQTAKYPHIHRFGWRK